MRVASVASITTALCLIVVKLITYLLTGSMAILSTLFDSIQDLMTSGVNMFAVKQALEPADAHHRVGHGKAQALGGLTQSVIIGISGLYLIGESIHRLFKPTPIQDGTLGIYITVFAIIVTWILISFQQMVIKRTNSISIKADRAHYTGDILMNVGVIVSILCAEFLGLTCVDSLFGLSVGVYLVYLVSQISKESLSALMDEEIPLHDRRQIGQIIASFPEVLDFSEMKTRSDGKKTFVQFCIFVDDNITLKKTHDLTDQIEAAIHAVLQDTDIIIHPEPISLKVKE